MLFLIQSGESVLHYCTRSGNEDVLLTIVNKIGPGAVQIALNKQSKVYPQFFYDIIVEYTCYFIYRVVGHLY